MCIGGLLRLVFHTGFGTLNGKRLFLDQEVDLLYLLYIISMYQQVLYYKVVPDMTYMLKALAFALANIIIGSIVFKILEKRFAEEL